MDIYNIKQISELVDGVSYEKIYRFFRGDYAVLSIEEIGLVEQVLKEQHKEALAIIKSAKLKVR